MTDWSPDGRYLAFTTSQSASTDVWVLPASGDRKPQPFVASPFDETNGQFSPDGRWMAYQSGESGRAEVYVAPFPEPGGKWQVSIAGGRFPRWRRDGGEIFYLSPENRMMTADVHSRGAGFEVGQVKTLFDTRTDTRTRYPYDVSADGQRFLLNSVVEQGSPSPITLVINWPSLLDNK
jgi:Tol biopolymer transport system component